MTETIGKVKLNLDLYPGEDFYSDGAIEDEMLSIAVNHPREEYKKIIEEKKNWPILYHFSSLRENIVEYLPFTGKEKVLEVGSGCGAITGVLSRKASRVTCVELSQKRSLINAYRNAECDNVCIHVGNFTDIEPTLPKDYDYICLIGVFEYAKGYIGSENPYVDFLNILKKHLAKDGRIVIAIENKYGMKYFAGATEDHLGSYFGGIENYREKGVARTFSKNGLEKIFKQCGFEESHFYYPYPDYKFMTTLFSEERLPGVGELSNNRRNYDRDRMQLFDEKAAFDGAIEEELFPLFSNSYVAVLGKKLDTIYSRYSNDRSPQFAIKTQMHKNEEGQIVVRKYPMSEASYSHVRDMQTAYEKLSDRFEGSDLKINKCVVKEEGNSVFAEFDFEKGKPLTELLDACLEKDDLDGFYHLFARFCELISFRKEVPVSDFDLIFSNILVDGDNWTLIDYEWTFDKEMDPRELAYRAVYCYILEDKKRNKLRINKIMDMLHVSEEEAEEYTQRELEFQKYVEDGNISMAVMRELIGRRILEPTAYLEKQIKEEEYKRVQIYVDLGNGYSEANSYFVNNAYVDEDRIELNLKVNAGVKMLRVDPAMDAGICKVIQMKFNGSPLDLHQQKFVIVNGKLLKEKDDDGNKYLTAIFPTEDPNINFALDKLSGKDENEIQISLQMVRVPRQMAQNLADGVKKIF